MFLFDWCFRPGSSGLELTSTALMASYSPPVPHKHRVLNLAIYLIDILHRIQEHYNYTTVQGSGEGGFTTIRSLLLGLTLT